MEETGKEARKGPAGFAASSRPDHTEQTMPPAGVMPLPSATTYGSPAPQKTFCYACGTHVDPRAAICTNCGVSQRQDPPGRAHPQATLALILNIFFPGVGTLVLGQVTPGVIQIVLWLLSIPLTFVLIGWPLYVGVWIWALVVAIQAFSNYQQPHPSRRVQ